MKMICAIVLLAVSMNLFGGSINQLADWKRRLAVERVKTIHRVLITNVEISKKTKKAKRLKKQLFEYEENLKIIKDQESLVNERALMIAKRQKISARNIVFCLPEFTGLINSMFHLFI